LKEAKSIREILDQWLMKQNSQKTVAVEHKLEHGVEDVERTALVEG
jgi:hypothetical protein